MQESNLVSQQSRTTHQPLVLVVDDDPDIREAIREVLEDADYAVAEAQHGREALGYLAHHPPPAAILLDLFMPVMDGWTFAKEVEAVPRLSGIPIIVVTASGAHWGYPSSQVLRKPLHLNQLLEVLRQLNAAGPPSSRLT